MGDTGVGAARAAAAAAPADASAAVASKAAAAVEAPSRTAPAYAANRKATADMPAEARFSVSWYDQSGADSYTDLDSSTATPRATISTDEGPFSGSPCCLHLHRLAILQHQVENKPETETLGSLPFLSSGIFNTGAPGGPPAPSDAVASLEAPAAAHEGKTEAGEAATEASELEGGEAAAAAAAAEGSLWNQGVTPLRSLMETMFSQGSLGAPRAQSTATFPIRRSRTSSMTGTREAFQGKLLGGAPLGPPADEIALPQTPPPERVRGPPLVPADKKKPGKKGGKKKKKKKARGAKRAPKGGSQPGPPPSSLLPTIENYWGPPFQRPHQEAFQGPHGAPLGSGASVERPDEEEISSFVSCVQGVSCLDGGGAPWLTDRQLGALILRVGGPLRCLSLGKNHVGVETEKALAACPNLEHLDLSSCEKLTSLSFLTAMKGLQVFFSNHQQLLSLNISFCCKSEPDAKLSSCLALLPDLQEVDCSGCENVSNGVLLRLSEICKGLRQLRLAGATSVRDESLKLLARLNCCKKLRLLDVRGCSQLSAASIEALLRASPSLSSIFLEGVNKISEDQIKQIKQKYPSCNFVRGKEVQNSAKGKPIYRKIASPEKKKKPPAPK